MVDSHTAGVMFTADPATGNRDHLVIEAAYGLGEVVVGGQVEPDSYVLAKDGRVLHQHLGTKATRIVRGGDGRTSGSRCRPRTRPGPRSTTGRWRRSHAWRERSSGTTARPRTSSSPSTTSASGSSSPGPSPRWGTPPPRVGTAGGHRAGVGSAAPGVAAGPVRILRFPQEGDRLVPGEVLVAPMTTPDWVPTMRRAAALVTDGGGVTCHAAIVGRELRLPTVVATRTATSVLRDGEIVTVDGTAGEVREGRPPATGRNGAPTPAAATTVEATAEPTATLLYVNLAIAEHAEEVAKLPVDGVGLLRAEFMITDALQGEHPKHLLATSRRRSSSPAWPSRCCASPGPSRPAGRVPRSRLPHQRVPRPHRRRGVRAGRGQPHDRLPGLLPLCAGPGAVRPRPGRAHPGAASRPPTST